MSVKKRKPLVVPIERLRAMFAKAVVMRPLGAVALERQLQAMRVRV